MPENALKNNAPMHARPRNSVPQNSAFPMTVAAFLIGVAVYWLPYIDNIGVCSTGTYVNVARGIALALLGFAGGITPRRWIAMAGAAGFVAGWILDLAASIQWPDIFHCSHQLLPFEAALVYLFAAVTAMTGYVLGRLVGRIAGHALRNRVFWAYAFIIFASAVTLSTPNLLPIELRANAAGAFRTLSALAQAQESYRARHPKTGYSCRLADISHELSASTPTDDAKREGYEDDFARGYRYRLWCLRGAPIRAGFVIEATPFCVPDCGSTYFCVDSSGAVRAASRPVPMDKRDGCWTGAATVKAGLF